MVMYLDVFHKTTRLPDFQCFAATSAVDWWGHICIKLYLMKMWIVACLSSYMLRYLSGFSSIFHRKFTEISQSFHKANENVSVAAFIVSLLSLGFMRSSEMLYRLSHAWSWLCVISCGNLWGIVPKVASSNYGDHS